MTDEVAKGRGAGPGRVLSVLVGLSIFLAIFVSVFLLARDAPSPIPPLPRAVISDEEVLAAMSALEERVAPFEPVEEERRLVALLRRINLAEAGLEGGAEDLDAARLEFAARAGELFDRDRERFLRLGEREALSFHDALAGLLGEARRFGLTVVIAKRGEGYLGLAAVGGSFMRMKDVGLFGEDGAMSASPILPQVLFRRRWCAMANRPGEEGLSPVERRASLDFIVAFADPRDIPKRLAAIDELVGLDAGYDAEIARAIVYEQGGLRARAMEILERAAAARPGDEVIERFLAFLSRDSGDAGR